MRLSFYRQLKTPRSDFTHAFLANACGLGLSALSHRKDLLFNPATFLEMFSSNNLSTLDCKVGLISISGKICNVFTHLTADEDMAYRYITKDISDPKLAIIFNAGLVLTEAYITYYAFNLSVTALDQSFDSSLGAISTLAQLALFNFSNISSTIDTAIRVGNFLRSIQRGWVE